MQIQLKQTEIVAALKQYITQQGIDLKGKQVSISFTAGRKESGISAELTIEDCDIPGFSEAEKEPVSLTLVASATVVKAAAESLPAIGDPPTDIAPLVDKIAKSVSLFN